MSTAPAARSTDASARRSTGAALAVGVVDDHLSVVEIHLGAHVVRGAAQRDHQLVERARAGDATTWPSSVPSP
jgi:hypothetical protein